MSETSIERRLVKSPPELWQELSDPAALARHLGEFGEIRITRMVPETQVVWEGDRATGRVEISGAGWGTRVTLTASLRTADPPDLVPSEPGDDQVEIAPGEGGQVPASAPERPDEPDQTVTPASPWDRSEPVTFQWPAAAPAPSGTAGQPIAPELEAPESACEPASPPDQPDPQALAGPWQTGLGEAPEPELLESEPAAWSAPEAQTQAETAGWAEGHPPHGGELEPRSAPEPQGETESTRSGFLGRLFGRRRGRTATAAQDAAVTPQSSPAADEPAPTFAPDVDEHAWASPAGPQPDSQLLGRERASVNELVDPPEATLAPEPPELSAEPAEALIEPTGRASGLLGAEPAELAGPAIEPPPPETADSAGELDAQVPHPPEAAENTDPQASGSVDAEAVLTRVLDDLGAAHHRPFSR